MNFWETKEAASYFAEKRDSLGLTQEDMVSDGLSRSTIGNIESLRQHVGRAKVALYCEKLGFTLEELPKLLEQRRQKKRSLEAALSLELKGIETIIHSIGAREGQSRLKQLQVPKSSPHRSMYHFLLGKCYFYKKNWTKTESNFSKALRIAEEFPELQKTNVKAVCMYELSRAYFQQNDIHNALNAAEQGLALFFDKGERQDIKYYLLLVKAVYLEILERNEEANRVLKKMWDNTQEINSEVYLNMSELQATLYNKQKMHSEAIDHLDKAIELARKERNYDRLYELWITMGSTYKQMEQLELAKICMKTASSIEKKAKNPILKGYNYIELGTLYFQEGEIELAEGYLRKAVQLCKQENNAHRYVDALIAHGDCLLEQEKREEAILNFEKGLRIAKKHNLSDQEKNTILKLAIIWEDNPTIHQTYINMLYDVSVRTLIKERK